MAAVIGNNVMLYWHRTDVDPEVDVAFACSTSCTFDVSVDQKEVTSQTSAWFREFKNDLATWSVTCDGLITLSGFSYLFMLEKQLARTPIEIKFVVDNGVDGLTIINGICNISSLSINAPQKDVATYNVSLQGTGAYNTTGTEVDPSGVIIVGSNPVKTKGYTAAGGETSITFADTIGYACLYVSRGGIDAQSILTSGTPTGDNVKFISSTGVLTFGRALEAGEFVRMLAQ
jgi:predicted secreted protein